MKIYFVPKTIIGRTAFILSICFVLMSMVNSLGGAFSFGGVFSPSPSTVVVGYLCFIGGIIAFKNKDRAVGTIISLVLGLIVVVSSILAIIP